MLRAALIVAAMGAIAAGARLAITGLRAPGVYLLCVGTAVLLGTVFERWRYRQEGPPEAHWEKTGERFEDTQSGKTVEVFFDPLSGERRYVSRDEPQGGSDRIN